MIFSQARGPCHTMPPSRNRKRGRRFVFVSCLAESGTPLCRGQHLKQQQDYTEVVHRYCNLQPAYARPAPCAMAPTGKLAFVRDRCNGRVPVVKENQTVCVCAPPHMLHPPIPHQQLHTRTHCRNMHWLNHGRSQLLDAPAEAIPANVPSVNQQSTAMLHPVVMIQPEMYTRDLRWYMCT